MCRIGAGPALNDLLGGQISLLWSAPPPVMPLVAAGKAKALAVASPQRLPDDPEVPTLAESGVPGFSVEIWHGVAAPAQRRRRSWRGWKARSGRSSNSRTFGSACKHSALIRTMPTARRFARW